MTDEMNDDSSADEHDPSELVSIGRVARETGLSPGTLRVWERRYGRPVPVRLESGHRRYTCDQVRWLRRVAEALARGHRPAAVVVADEDALDGLLREADPEPGLSPETRRLKTLVVDGRGDELDDALRASWDDLGPRRFLSDRVAPLVREIGRAWADGEIEVRHEHLASERIEDLLRTMRGSLPGNGGPVVLLSTLPGESHGLGLQMAALMARVEGADVRVLGTETPEPQIAAATVEQNAAAVAISVSLSTGGPETDRRLAALRAVLSDEVELVVGGAGGRGVRRGVRGVRYVDLEEFGGWLRGLCSDGGGGDR